MARCADARKRSDYRPMSPRDMILCPSVEKRNTLDSRREIVQTLRKSQLLAIALLQVVLLQPACAADKKPDECGLASVYSSASEVTASDEDTLPENFTAAHRTLPFGTLVHVENKKNGRWAVVRITDRGPTIDGRIIDISQVAARALDISGLAQVCLSIVWMPESRAVDGK